PAASVGYRLSAAFLRSPDRMRPGVLCQGLRDVAGGIISKRADAPYSPGDRGLWVKVKCENREEFMVVGWTDSRGCPSLARGLLLAYYDPTGRLVYAGRVGAGIDYAELGRLWRYLQPLATSEMPSIRLPLGPTGLVHRWY